MPNFTGLSFADLVCGRMSLPKEKAWFAAKRYGYGWGLPKRWQGWLVLGLYLVGLTVIGAALKPGHPLVFIGYVIISTASLIAVCACKGEPPGWRWGGADDS